MFDALVWGRGQKLLYSLENRIQTCRAVNNYQPHLEFFRHGEIPQNVTTNDSHIGAFRCICSPWRQDNIAIEFIVVGGYELHNTVGRHRE
jgi:hypothetical protein